MSSEDQIPGYADWEEKYEKHEKAYLKSLSLKELKKLIARAKEANNDLRITDKAGYLLFFNSNYLEYILK